MAFRDDRDALRAKVDAALQELEDARKKLEAHEEKDERDEAELAKLRSEVERLTKAVGERKKSASAARKSGGGRGLVTYGIFVAVFTGGIVAYVTLKAGDPPPRVIEAAPNLPTEVTDLTPPAAPAPPAPTGRVLLAAVVTKVEGETSVAIGDGCVVDVTRTGAEAQVRCGAETVFDSNGQSHGFTLRYHTLESGESRSRVAVEWRDGAAEMHLNSREHQLRVWSDAVDLTMRVAPLSAPTGWAAPGAELAPRRWAAELERGDDAAPPHSDACVLERHVPTETGSCRFVLACGETVLYGAGTSGYVPCTETEANDTSYDDGDPIFRLAGERVDVEGERDGRFWRERFVLSDDPRCSLEGEWRGHFRRGTGSPLVPVSLSENTFARFEGLGAEGGPVQTQLDCASGRITMTRNGQTFAGEFGPEFRTVLLRAEDESTIELFAPRGT